jgi:hypothetical protein
MKVNEICIDPELWEFIAYQYKYFTNQYLDECRESMNRTSDKFYSYPPRACRPVGAGHAAGSGGTICPHLNPTAGPRRDGRPVT